jgi:fatty acid desaturase
MAGQLAGVRMQQKLDGRLDSRALRTLAGRSDIAGWLQLLGHVTALGLTGTLVLAVIGSPWLLPAMALHGIVLVFLFAPLHETIHRTAFASRRANNAVAFLVGLPLVLPPAWFRAFHFTHHRHTQDPRRDPELATPKPTSRASWLLHVSGLPYWRERLRTTTRQALGRVDDPFVPPRERPAVTREARSYLALYAAVLALAAGFGSAWPLVLWIGPALLGQPFLRLYLLAEHTGCPLVPDMLANTRTTLTNRIVRRLAWNMPYHAEHHAYPAIPFHRLPDAHALLRNDLAVIGDGYLAVNLEILTALDGERAAREPAGSS